METWSNWSEEILRAYCSNLGLNLRGPKRAGSWQFTILWHSKWSWLAAWAHLRSLSEIQSCAIFLTFRISVLTSNLVAQMVKNVCNPGHLGSIPGSGRSPGEGSGYPLQYSCLENPRGDWWAVVHEVAKSQTRLSN